VVSDPHRLSPWLTVLAVLATLLAFVLVGRDAYRLAESEREAASRATPTAGLPVASLREPQAPVADRAVPPPVVVPETVVVPAPEGASEEAIVRVRDGERVALHRSPGGEVVAEVDDETSFGSTTSFSVNRSRPGWLGVPSEVLPNGELAWVRSDPEELRGDTTPYRIVVDLSTHEARLYRTEQVVREWPVTVGTAATPTPTGSFSVTDLIEGGLNPVYGCCAIAISATQPYLPAGWTGGDRIAFHGNGTNEPLGVDASNGCIRSPDEELQAVIRTVPLGTPVRIVE
jgi:lipoprotein-anchoring transpeptidase ErfK/SrfK